MITMQYSGAQNVLPISKEGILTPDEEPDVQGGGGAQGPIVPEEEPEAQVEEPEPQKEEPPVVGQGEPEVQGGDESQEQTTPTDPRKGPMGGLDIANTTQQTLPPAFKIKIIFDAIKPNPANKLWPSYKEYCEDWDMGVYVQGKLVRLNNINQPLKICGDRTVQLKNAEAFVDIPGESVESIKDYQPLSIFSAGSELNKCNPEPLPADLPEVRKILADKGSTRLGDAKEEISKIQSQTGNGCIEKSYQASIFSGQCVKYGAQYICPWYYVNQTLSNLHYLFGSPGYGKVLPRDTLGNPERIQVDSCSTYGGTPRHFCLFYTLECASCAGVRVH
jgi:hypothetical protein